MDNHIKMTGINKIYPNGAQAVFDFDLDIKKGEFIVLVGPSGCGKSTLLRMIAGLEEITSGDMFINETRINDLAPADRDIAMVFQNYALYGHMTVYENMGFSKLIRKTSDDDLHKAVMDVSKIVELEEYLSRKPANLSGGQRQRVSLGRAIVRDSEVFLMDEPLSNLDAKLRASTRKELVEIQRRLGSTVVYVTHDQIEAMTMASRIVVLKDGYVQQIDAPKEVYRNPNNLFVAEFIGSPTINKMVCTVKDNAILINGTKVELSESNKELLKSYDGKKVIMAVRPEHVTIGDTVDSIIEYSELLGHESIVKFKIGQDTISAKVKTSYDVTIGKKVKLDIDIQKMLFFDLDSEERIKR